VRKYIKDVCVAIDLMHRHDIIHRDIKPENVIIHENTIKICDFGWAVHSPLLRNTKSGTPLYTPPEMVKDEYYDSKIDIWCIGVLTYEVLYGTIPF
jgi:aurora kinase